MCAGNFDQALCALDTTRNSASLLDFQTDAGAIIISSAYVQFKFRPSLPPLDCTNVKGYLVKATSSMGEVFLTEVSAPGIYAYTGGSIHANFLAASAIVQCKAVCADVHLETTGYGAIGLSRVFSANNANFTSDMGRIALNSASVAIGHDLRVWSNTGVIHISNFLQVCMGMGALQVLGIRRRSLRLALRSFSATRRS
jgi:hypothetical protein